MLRASKRTMLLTSIITLLPVLVGLFFWDRLPDQMATHFGAGYRPDGYSSKAFAVFGLPLFLLAMHWFAAFVTTRDPKRQNISPKLFALVLWIVPAVSLICAAAIYAYNLGYEADLSLPFMLLTGILFIIVGNYLPKARQNYTIGIRVPWTLASEENWNRTHRLAGRLWVAGGILIVLLSVTGQTDFRLMLAVLIIIAVVPCIYSYLRYAKEKE